MEDIEATRVLFIIQRGKISKACARMLIQTKGSPHVETDKAKKIKELRESTGMNRKEFCEYFAIPYRTVSEWERDGRHAPDYLIRLLEYYIRMEKVVKKDAKEE